jgi:hypothetical protein
MWSNAVRDLVNKAVDIYLVSGDRVQGVLVEVNDEVFRLSNAQLFRESMYVGPPISYSVYSGKVEDISSVAVLPPGNRP